MHYTVTCTSCSAALEVNAKLVGREVECPGCHKIIVVPDASFGPGTTIGGFEIKSLLGRGGMGEVYLAHQNSMSRDVALKVLPRGLVVDKDAIARFLTEVRLAAKLEHTNLVTAYEAGDDSGIYYFAMSYVRGESLDKKLKKEGAFSEHDALGIVRKVASALQYAWEEHGLIHRDIKPANIILDHRGEPKLTDMGLSKSLREKQGLTVASTVMGTPNYMSPEQAEGKSDINFRADI